MEGHSVTTIHQPSVVVFFYGGYDTRDAIVQIFDNDETSMLHQNIDTSIYALHSTRLDYHSLHIIV